MKFAVSYFVAFLACASASYAPYYAVPYPAYAGTYASYPAADIKVLPNGFLADTPEVAHAKAAHLAEKAKVASSAAYAPVPAAYVAPYAAPAAYVASYPAPAAYVTPYTAAPNAYVAPYYAGSYAHSVADIKVLPSGFLADTPEVAHAKAAHFVEKAKSAAAAAAAPEHGSYAYAAPAYTAPAYSAPSYVAPAYAAPANAAPAYAAPAYAAPAYSHY